MQLADGVYAFPIEFEFDGRHSTIYPTAIERDGDVVLFDAGMPGGLDSLTSALEDEGLSVSDVALLVLTHQDVDHAGCASAVVDASGATVVAHREDAPYVEGEEELIKSSADRDFSYAPVPVDVQLTDGERVRTDAGPAVAVHTPGHTPGHTSYYLPDERLLLSADALNAADGRLVGPREGATPDMDAALSSVAKLAAYDVERVLCYHGGLAEAGADRIAEIAEE